MISRFMVISKVSHWKVGKRILRYVNGTKYFGIMYSNSEDFKLVRYTSRGNIDDSKSTSLYTFHFEIGIVSWASRKQPIVTLSSAKT
jgi:hypothetical protein